MTKVFDGISNVKARSNRSTAGRNQFLNSFVYNNPPIGRCFWAAGGETYQGPGEISMESVAGNILVTEEIPADYDTLGATYEVLGRVFRLRNFALLGTTAGGVWILLRNVGYVQE